MEPLLVIEDYNPKKPNPQSWRKLGDNLYQGRVCVTAKVEFLAGWLPVSNWCWKTDSMNFVDGNHEEHNKTWGSFSEHRKCGGKFSNINNCWIKFTALRTFEKDGVKKKFSITYIWGKVYKPLTEKKPEKLIPMRISKPEEQPERDLIFSFVKGRWLGVSGLVALLQSLLYFRNIKHIWTHVQYGFSDSDQDLSAEAKGLVWVSRKESRKKARDFVSFMVPGMDRKKFNIVERLFNEYAGSRYDFFFYIRWFFNVMLLIAPIVLLTLAAEGKFWITIIVMAIIYIPINIWLKGKSRFTWACSEFGAKIMYEIDIDPPIKPTIDRGFGYGVEFHQASPTDEYRMVRFDGWKMTDG